MAVGAWARGDDRCAGLIRAACIDGETVPAAARKLGIPERTARRWVTRFRDDFAWAARREKITRIDLVKDHA